MEVATSALAGLEASIRAVCSSVGAPPNAAPHTATAVTRTAWTCPYKPRANGAGGGGGRGRAPPPPPAPPRTTTRPGARVGAPDQAGAGWGVWRGAGPPPPFLPLGLYGHVH